MTGEENKNENNAATNSGHRAYKIGMGYRNYIRHKRDLIVMVRTSKNYDLQMLYQDRLKMNQT